MTARAAVKRAAYRTGALGALHRYRNRDHLTVVTLHRVLAESDPRFATADPRYTMTDRLFAQMIDFLGAHYTPVGLDAIRAAATADEPLPPNALLVTIDDGWADTYDSARPILVGAQCPALVFVNTTAIEDGTPFWPERLVAAWRAGRLVFAGMPAPWSALDAACDWQRLQELVRWLRAEPSAHREQLVESLLADEPAPPSRAMMTRGQVAELAAAGIEIGAHGMSHEPIPSTSDLDAEIAAPRAELGAMVDDLPDAIDSMSFPHGSYDARCIAAARSAGYSFIFTSDTTLHPLRAGAPTSDVIGRIGIPADAISDDAGELREELLALWLMRRPRAAVAA